MGSFRRPLRTFVLAALLSVSVAAIGGRAQTTPPRKPMSLVDLASLQRIAGAPPQLSPDGKTVAYLLSKTDWKAGRQIFQLWRQEVAGGAPVQLTFSEGGVQPGALRWSPDGKTLLFLRDGQIALLPLDGGEPRTLTKHATNVSSPRRQRRRRRGGRQTARPSISWRATQERPTSANATGSATTCS
jgi:dipeptidyl aminopeptidase/acylaminoacyl peptidase